MRIVRTTLNNVGFVDQVPCIGEKTFSFN